MAENEQARNLSMRSRVDADEEDDLDIIADLEVPPLSLQICLVPYWPEAEQPPLGRSSTAC